MYVARAFAHPLSLLIACLFLLGGSYRVQAQDGEAPAVLFEAYGNWVTSSPGGLSQQQYPELNDSCRLSRPNSCVSPTVSWDLNFRHGAGIGEAHNKAQTNGTELKIDQSTIQDFTTSGVFYRNWTTRADILVWVKMDAPGVIPQYKVTVTGDITVQTNGNGYIRAKAFNNSTVISTSAGHGEVKPGFSIYQEFTEFDTRSIRTFPQYGDTQYIALKNRITSGTEIDHAFIGNHRLQGLATSSLTISVCPTEGCEKDANLKLESVSDVDPFNPVVSYSVQGTFEDVEYVFDEGNPISLGSKTTGKYEFTINNLNTYKFSKHTLILRGRSQGRTVEDIATVDTSRMQQGFSKNWTVTANPIFLARRVTARWSLRGYKWEWSLPGARWDRLMDGNPVSTVGLGSNLPREDTFIKHIVLPNLTVTNSSNDGKYQYERADTLSDGVFYSAAFELNGPLGFGKAGTTKLTLVVPGISHQGSGARAWVFWDSNPLYGEKTHVLQ